MAAKTTRMKHPDVRYAMASRDWGLRRLRRLTLGIAGAGAAGAVLLALGFDVHAHHAQTSGAAGSGAAGSGAVQTPAASRNTGGTRQGGQLQPPLNNPLPAGGPGQVVSGGS